MTDRRNFHGISAGAFFVASAGTSFGGTFGPAPDRVRAAPAAVSPVAARIGAA